MGLSATTSPAEMVGGWRASPSRGGGAPGPGPDTAALQGHAIAAGMALAKDLGNLPGNICTPSHLAGLMDETAYTAFAASA